MMTRLVVFRSDDGPDFDVYAFPPEHERASGAIRDAEKLIEKCRSEHDAHAMMEMLESRGWTFPSVFVSDVSF